LTSTRRQDFCLCLMFMVPYILIIYVQLRVQLDVLIMYSLFLSIFNSTWSSGSPTIAYSHRCVCNNFGVLIHWSSYWLGHPRTFTTATLRLVCLNLTVVKVRGCPSQYLLQWINRPKPLHTTMAVSYSWSSWGWVQ
jgi:hypothetical protein